MKINGMNVIGVKHLAGILKGLNGYGLHYEVFLPIEGGKLRLYCLRISEQIVILGNGGVKTTRTYEEDSKLYGYVLDLQRFEEILNDNIAKGYVRIEERELNGIDDVVFEI